jgi:hypothetical protein
MDELQSVYIPHLREQFRNGRPILFTGAGFSADASSIRGGNLPTGRSLTKLLWPICFPSDPYDADTSLQDLYGYALQRERTRLTELLVNTFTVSDADLPAWYGRIFSLPWRRIYTLNIDNLEDVVNRTQALPRRLKSNSASQADESKVIPPTDLEVMHLNGSLEEVPDRVTFSPTQYAQRLAGPDPVYRRLAAELVSSPFVFIGSALDESTLWQSIEARRWKGGRGHQELRPRSYLVSKSLSPAKLALLASFNVVWIPMTGETFCDEVLSHVGDAATEGLQKLLSSTGKAKTFKAIPDVSQLAVTPEESSEYLLGYQPIWADIQSGRAIKRVHDDEVWKIVSAQLKASGIRGAVLISGTSGAGKSTALMRVALRLSAQGTAVLWADPEEDLSPGDVRSHVRSMTSESVVAIDDADLYGAQLSPLIRELVTDQSRCLVLLAVRSGRVDRVMNPNQLSDIPVLETVVPLLEDTDIDQLIEVLHRENRPGQLKGLPLPEQRKLFRDQSGRELLVAMIQATSGKRFADKVIEEMTGLTPEAARIYGLVSVATAFRFGLSNQDILIALGDETNAALNAVEMLVRRKIVRRGSDGFVYARHRIIAEVVREALQVNGQLSGIVQGLAMLAASYSQHELRRSSRPRRILRAILNHDFLQRSLGIESTRNLYGSLEQILSWDFHYWLQRGSFEVERGDLSLAENFLNQAHGLAPDDPFVETERAYLLFSQAIENPNGVDAPESIGEATTILEFQMTRMDRRSPHPFHVMGSQGLAWSRRGAFPKGGREKYIRELMAHVEEGVRQFPRENDLQILLDDLKREQMQLAVTIQPPLFKGLH